VLTGHDQVTHEEMGSPITPDQATTREYLMSFL